MPSVVNIAIEAMGQRVKLEQSGGDLAYDVFQRNVNRYV